MINSFYLKNIDTKKNVTDTLRFILNESIFFNGSQINEFEDAIRNVADSEYNHPQTPWNNELSYLNTLINESKFYKKILQKSLLIDNAKLDELELESKADFEKLSKFSRNLKTSKHLNTYIVNRTSSLRELSLSLKRRINNNTLIIGRTGSGKSFLVETFARLNNHNILSINPAYLVAGTKYRGEFEDRISMLFGIISKYRITVFIDEIHTVIGLGGGDGGIDLNNMLKPIIELENIRLIGATTEDEYQMLAKDKAFRRRFNLINIKEFSPEEASELFKDLLDNVLRHYPELRGSSKEFTDYMIKSKDTILSLLNRYHNNAYPSKLVNFFDYCSASYIQQRDIKDVERCIAPIMN